MIDEESWNTSRLKWAAAANPLAGGVRAQAARNSVAKRGEAISHAGMLGARAVERRVETKVRERG